jgi:serine protease Do
VIISPDGYIVTNNHVVEGATQIRVTMSDRRIFTGKVVGTDKLTDLAVIKVAATGLPAIAWGDSTKLEPGQTVLAFGSPFGSLRFSVTRGIVSAINRANPYRDDPRKPGDFIQTDAAINPGNSGGALVNAHGELIGINASIISSSGAFQGAGFAIPSQIVQSTTAQLIQHGKVEHGYLGISMNDVTPENAEFFKLQKADGAIVSQVTPDSPAGRGGVKQGDVITSLNGREILNSSELQVAVSQMQPGATLKLGVLREGRPVNLGLTVGTYKAKSEVAANDDTDDTPGATPKAGKLGLAVAALNDETRQQLQAPEDLHGVVIENVRPDSPADEAGLQRGDVILEVNRRAATSPNDFVGQVKQSQPGKDLLLLVWSRGNATYRTVHPAEANG